MGTYGEIKLLIKDLNGNKVLQRRAAGEKLQSMLSQPEIRRRLALEVSIPEGQRGRISMAGAQKMALAEVWRYIIQSAINSVQSILDGKTKITESDIQMPYKLIRSCDIPDSDNDPGSGSNQNYYSNPPKLDKKTTRLVFEFCMEMLDHKVAVELAELTLLQMLGYICSRREYVAYFKPHAEISAIMEEVEKRIVAKDDESKVEHRVILEAGKVFENIIKTAVYDLGLSLDLLIPGCAKLVANWCTVNRSKPGLISELPHVMNAFSILLESNPEQSIAPITRYGRTIISFVKKRYKHSPGQHRMSLNRYLLRHILTSQVAGKLSGLMPGDLGDLGAASLTDKDLTSLMDLVLQDLGKISDDAPWPFESSQMLQMELTARLLCCSQRYFLMNAEWSQIKDPMKELSSFIENTRKNDNLLCMRLGEEESFHKCHAPNIHESPFVTRILGHLYSLGPDSPDTMVVDMQHRSESTIADGDSSLWTAAREASKKCRPDPKLLIPLVQVILICAEIFPTGSCWTSSFGEGWRRFKISGDLGVETFVVSGSTPGDLASVIHIVSNVLETFGGSNGSPNIQKWTLLCLIRLAETSATLLVSSSDHYSNQSYTDLQRAWRRVWSLIFRPDLRYTSWTKSTITKGSNGEFVLLLLANMIRYDCTDVSNKKVKSSKKILEPCHFLINHQSDLWTLPVFSNVNIESSSPFVLIYTVLYYVGLQNHQASVIQDSRGLVSPTAVNIRQQLLLFCLQYCEKYLAQSKFRIHVCFASICASALCSGRPPSPRVMFELLNEKSQSSASSFLDKIITSYPNKYATHSGNRYERDSLDLFALLWVTPNSCPSDSQNILGFDMYLDDALGDIIKIRKLVSSLEESTKSSDFIPQSQSQQLFDLAREHLDVLLERHLRGTNQELSFPDEIVASSSIPVAVQTIAVKIYITQLLARPLSYLSTDFVSITSRISEVFCSVASYISSLEFNQDDVCFACMDLVGILIGILDTSSQLQSELPPTFVENASSLVKACEVLLDSYTPGVSVHQSSSGTQKATLDDNLMDDDFDGVMPGQHKLPTRLQQEDSDIDFDGARKRKRKEAHRKLGRQKQSHPGAKLLNHESAFRVGSLLVTLCPSLSECEFVARALVGVNDVDDSLASPYDVDVLGCLHALELICSDIPIMHQLVKANLHDVHAGNEKTSLPSLICQLVKLLRMASKPHSDFFLFGYTICAKLVHLCDADFHGFSLTENEANDIIDLFQNKDSSHERRHLMFRPGYRINQVGSAIDMFKGGKATFHSVFDKDFPRAFVLPSLLDNNGAIRRLGCAAVALAMQVLPEERVVESVRKRLPPVISTGTDGEVKVIFRKWYAEKKFQGSDSNLTREKQVWEDAFLSIQCGVTECLGSIAMASASVEIQQEILLDLFQLASYRPTLEGLVYQIVEKIAGKAGHRNVENFLEVHREHLIRRWLESGISLFDAPLIMTAPYVLCILLQHGQYLQLITDECNTSEQSEDGKLDYQHLKEVAASEFIARRIDVVLPQSLLLVLQQLQPSAVPSDRKILILKNKYVGEVCSVFNDTNGEKVLEVLIRKYIPCLIAHASVANSTAVQGDGSGTLELIIRDFLTGEEYQRLGERHAATALIQLIEATGRLTNSLTAEIGVDSMQRMISQFGSSRSKTNDLFEHVASSTTEALVFAKFHLDKCVSTQELTKRWTSFNVIFQFIVERIRQSSDDRVHLGFCLHLLQGIVVNEQLISIHHLALSALATIVKEVADRRLSNGGMLMKDLLCIVFHVHENCQRNLVMKCYDLRDFKRRMLGRSMGVCARQSSCSSDGDVWGWSAGISHPNRCPDMSNACADHLSGASNDLYFCIETLKASFALLQLLINNGEGLGLSRDVLVCLPLDNICKSTLGELSETNPFFCAQSFIKNFLSSHSVADNVVTMEERLPAIICRMQSQLNDKVSMVSAAGKNVKYRTNDSLFTNQTLLVAELTELLRHLQLQNLTIGSKDKIKLIQELRTYCISCHSDEVRLLASRCLGEIDFSGMNSPHSLEPPKDWIYSAISRGRLLSAMKARCIEALAFSLKSKEAIVAMTALETLKAILTSRLCRDCQEFLDDQEVTDLLDPFFVGRQPAQVTKKLMLTEYEIHDIQPDDGTGRTESSWCWDTRLWVGSLENGRSFASWICGVVPALLVCCYRKSDGTPESVEHDDFFLFCQRMSYLDAGFAEVLFPTIVLDLLLNSNSDTPYEVIQDRVVLDTWITNRSNPTRINLSKSFNAVLKFFRKVDDNGIVSDRTPVELIVQCLDLLRRLTQHRFESSPNHRRNPLSPKAESSKKSKSINFSEGMQDEERENAVVWRGVPYGVVLSLNGTNVAEACIQSNKVAAALFYAEMFADCRFHGSATAFDSAFKNQLSQIPTCDVSTSDISGYGRFDDVNVDLGFCSLQEDTLSLLGVLRKCFVKLGEQDAIKAVDQNVSDFSVFPESQVFDYALPRIEQFELLENVSDMEGKSVQGKLALADAFERTGLRNTLSNYVQGLLSEDTALFESDQASLKEKWYSCRLFEQQWNDNAFLVLSESQSQRSIDLQIKFPGPGGISFSDAGSTSGTAGFYECMTRGMFALRDGDFDTFRFQLKNARMQLVDQMTICGTDYASLWKTLDVVDKLRTVNDLEILSPSEDSMTSLLTQVSLRSRRMDQRGIVPSLIFKFSADIHEITMKCFPIMAISSSALPTVRKHLIEHLQQVSAAYCECGLHKDADAAIRRLYAMFKSGVSQGEELDRSSALLDLRMRKAVLLEKHNDFSGAIRSAKQTIKLLSTVHAEELSSDRKVLLADAMVRCGSWMIKHKVEPASSVLKHYFHPAADVAQTLYSNEKNKANAQLYISALLSVSQLVVNLFESVSSRVKSLHWKRAGAGLEERRLDLSKSNSMLLEANKRLSLLRKKQSPEYIDAEKEFKELQLYRINLEREIRNTEMERQKIEASVEEHRIIALKSMVSALSISGGDETEDLSKYVYRFVAIWFSSQEDNSWTEQISSVIKNAVENIPTFRFVPLASQLFSRISADLSSDEESCQYRLQQLILKMCRQHPYHCVAQLIALSNGKRLSSPKPVKSVAMTKGDVASSLMVTLKKTDPDFLQHLIESYESLTSAYINLAMADTKDFNRGLSAKIPMEKVCKSSTTRLDKCLGSGARRVRYPPCILTKPPPIRPGCDYGDGLQDPIGGERIVSFESYFAITEGGLHRPKIVTCVGSKGGKFRELVKGEDDTRQDAVMEQVFDYVNSIMARQRIVININQNVTQISTRSDLKLVTYNIVPLSPESGVLEWVEHAIPFGEFIVGKGGKKASDIGAHSRYYPGEWGHSHCRSHLDTVQRNEKRRAFDDICCNHSPVFRYFFVERFGFSLEHWYAAKMRYTRSVAVSSIVGHILGIGDRHTSNILVHQKSGEVVHIDFGIVFDQGKLLNTPEQVPFRLTRNVVDGMGPLGTEGTFMRAAESTLAALKNNASALLTILSAIVADPLYKWSIVSFENTQHRPLAASSVVRSDKSRRISSGSASSSKNARSSANSPDNIDFDENIKNENEAAAHAIRKIHEKLQGYEDGTSGEQQSAEGQVSLLVSSARDQDNLCYMFPGWAPWI